MVDIIYTGNARLARCSGLKKGILACIFYRQLLKKGKNHADSYYFGAMRQLLELQQKGETFLFIADYHALTTGPKADDLRSNVYHLALDFLSCGLSLDNTVFFRQSDVPQVTELMWILNNITTVGFTYPVLMAADILLYGSELVPVGKDQKQHLEITRDLAIRFNNDYEETFKLPEAYIPTSVAVVPGIDGQKMSKSYGNTIPLFGAQKAIRKIVMSIVTDSTPMEDPKDPDKCNVVALYKLVATPEEVEEMKAKYRAGNYGYGHAKQALFEKLWAYFEPMRERRAELEKDPDYIWDVLREGGKKAAAEAEKTMARVRRAVGLR